MDRKACVPGHCSCCSLNRVVSGVRSLAVAARIGRADLSALAEPRALAIEPMYQFSTTS